MDSSVCSGRRPATYDRDRGTHEGLGGLLDPRCESKAGFTSWRNVRCRPEVHHLIDYESKTWNEPLLRELVRADDVTKIVKMKPSRLGRKDGYTWSFTKSGAYTVRAGYEVTNERWRALGEAQVA